MVQLVPHFGLFALFISVAECLLVKEDVRPPLLPYPAVLHRAHGTRPFKLGSGVRLSVGEGIPKDDLSVVDLKALLARIGKAGAGGKAGVADRVISLHLAKQASTSAEGYSLHITDKAVELKAAGLPGLFYGVQTLRQLVQKQSVGAQWPALTILDAPRFGWRGLHLDVSRHFFKAEKVKKLLEVMASFKMNRFHWHLTDDQGWRLPVDGYPKLTEVGGQGEAYTKEEVKDVVAFARARHIEVIPEIDVPGHVEAALAAYPELGNVDIPGRVAPRRPRVAWGVSHYTLAPSNATWSFLDKVYDTVEELFPSKFVHIGGDEVVKEEWHQSPAAISLADSLGKQVGALFENKVSEMLRARGRRSVAWNEAQHSAGFPSDGVVMAWTSANEAEEAVSSGRQAVVSDLNALYFDRAQAWSGEPKSQGGCVSWQTVYEYEPMPRGIMEEEEQTLVLGAQGQLWSEYIPTWRHMEYMAHPRSLALAERVWTPSNMIQGTADFERRLRERLSDLDDLGVNYKKLGNRC